MPLPLASELDSSSDEKASTVTAPDLVLMLLGLMLLMWGEWRI